MGRRIIAVIAALVIAIIGAGAVVAYASSADSRAVAGQEVRSVYIAQLAVPKGMSARAAAAKHLIAPAQVVAKGAPAGALTDLAEEGASDVALGTIPPGSVVLKSSFGKADASSEQAATAVPKGKVAITASLADPERVAPLLKPGAHIVIYDTYGVEGANSSATSSDAQGQGQAQATHVLLPDAEVIAVGSSVVSSAPAPKPGSTATKDGSSSDSQAPSGALVTVAVTPTDAITLVHGIQTGTLYAGLLGSEAKVDRGESVTAQTLFGK